jgi:hypothetical protein
VKAFNNDNVTENGTACDKEHEIVGDPTKRKYCPGNHSPCRHVTAFHVCIILRVQYDARQVGFVVSIASVCFHAAEIRLVE